MVGTGCPPHFSRSPARCRQAPVCLPEVSLLCHLGNADAGWQHFQGCRCSLSSLPGSHPLSTQPCPCPHAHHRKSPGGCRTPASYPSPYAHPPTPLLLSRTAQAPLPSLPLTQQFPSSTQQAAEGHPACCHPLCQPAGPPLSSAWQHCRAWCYSAGSAFSPALAMLMGPCLQPGLPSFPTWHPTPPGTLLLLCHV